MYWKIIRVDEPHKIVHTFGTFDEGMRKLSSFDGFWSACFSTRDITKGNYTLKEFSS